VMARWRVVFGNLLILIPFVVLAGGCLLGVLLGSMGMDIHWTSKMPFYVAAIFGVLIIFVSVISGVRLRRSARD
jgi:uncharacterized integral membrane protein